LKYSEALRSQARLNPTAATNSAGFFMQETGKYSDTFFQVAMSIGLSLDLDEMLRKALDALYEKLALSGVSVLFFSDSIEQGLVYRSVYSNPPHLHDKRYFTDALKSLGSLKHASDPESLKRIFPSTGFVNAEGEKRFYYIFLLPYIGLLTLFTENKGLDDSVVSVMVPITEKLAVACSACLQNLELELVSASTRNINRELSQSDLELRKNILQIQNDQAEIVNNRAYLAMILQSLGEGIIVLDEKLQVKVMNVRAMEYLDYLPSENGESPVRNMFQKCDITITEIKSFIFSSDDNEYMDIKITSGRQHNRTLRISKNRIQNLVSVTPEIILLLRDITAELEAERLKNEFISNLSHELRTPMNAILGISQVILNKNNKNLNDRQKEGLSIINESGNRLLSLINDILDLSKIEAGKMLIVAEPFYLRDLISSIEIFVKALIGDKGLTFNLEINNDVPGCIIADRKRIEQVLMNLLGNSVKFTEQGNISLRIRREKDTLFFICSDSGIGINEKDVPYIFDRFRQIDGSLSRKYSGTGLGLSLSKEFVRLMGGVISVESEPEIGTAVHFGIPLNEGDICTDIHSTVHNVEKIECEESVDDISVLITDDEDSSRVTLEMMLERNYSLMFAENGADAFELAKKHHPDIIIMDIMMPVLDGIQAFHMLRGDPNCANIPVVALTAHAFPGEKENIMSEGFDGYITKPVDEKILFSTIKHHVKGPK
jgi:signal transduction histidine kinase/ActR/RegA family two-component response regulator